MNGLWLLGLILIVFGAYGLAWLALHPEHEEG